MKFAFRHSKAFAVYIHLLPTHRILFRRTLQYLYKSLSPTINLIEYYIKYFKNIAMLERCECNRNMCMHVNHKYYRMTGDIDSSKLITMVECYLHYYYLGLSIALGVII